MYIHSIIDGHHCDFGLKGINNSINIKQSVRIDKAIVTTVTHSCVATLNCAFFVNKSMVKWSEQRTEFLLTWSESSLKIKFINYFLMLGSVGNQCKQCFPQLGTAHRLYSFCIDMFASLVNTTWQWCQSRRWSSSVEAVLITLLHYRVEHSTSCCFGRLTAIKAVFRLMTKSSF